jgi:hypothetical protein
MVSESLLEVPRPLEKKRWYMLILYSSVATAQSLVWGSYSVTPGPLKDYYPTLTDSGINLLLNWGTITIDENKLRKKKERDEWE